MIRALHRLIFRLRQPDTPREIAELRAKIELARSQHGPVKHLEKKARDIRHARLRSSV